MSGQLRMASCGSEEPESAFKEAIGIVGGRPTHLFNIARHPDMINHALHLLQVEIAWLQSQIGLIPNHDEAVHEEVSGVDDSMTLTNVHSKTGVHARGCSSRSL